MFKTAAQVTISSFHAT